MCTFLGTAGRINDDDVESNLIKNAEITFLEGYLWDEGEPKKAFDKAIKNSRKVAMSLSDLFCVERHKSQFLELVKNRLDIIFANEQEILSLISTNKFEEVISFCKQLNKNIIITRGEKYCNKRKKYLSVPLKNLKLKILQVLEIVCCWIFTRNCE